jgi:hypothetical protein
VALLEDLPVLLIHGEADTTVPVAEGRRLAMAGGSGLEHWTIPGAGHALGRPAAPEAWDERVTAFLRAAFTSGRDREVALGILGSPAADPSNVQDVAPQREEADERA